MRLKRNIYSFLLILSFSLLLSKPTLGQQFFRLKADFSIKENLIDGSSSLSMGTVYFDRTKGKVVYNLKFPSPSLSVLTDTAAYEIADGKIKAKVPVLGLVDFSIFNLSMSDRLGNYGLTGKNTLYQLVDVAKEDSLVISTWRPTKKELKEAVGDVLISQKNKQLYGIVFMDKNNQPSSKQFFNNYKLFSGLMFPTEIVQINYKNGKEFYKVTTFKNIKVNDLSENIFYNFSIPLQ